MSRGVSMTGDEIPAEPKGISLSRILAVLLFVFFLLSLHLPGQTAAPPNAVAKTGTLADLRWDKRVVQNGRWFLVREFTVDFAVRDMATYCGESTTTDATVSAWALIRRRSISLITLSLVIRKPFVRSPMFTTLVPLIPHT